MSNKTVLWQDWRAWRYSGYTWLIYYSLFLKLSLRIKLGKCPSSLLSLYNVSVLFLDLSRPLFPSSLSRVTCSQSHFEDEKERITRYKQRTGTSLVFPGLQKSLAEALLLAKAQCAEPSFILVMMPHTLPPQGQLCCAELQGFIPAGQAFIPLILHALVSWLIQVTGEQLTPHRPAHPRLMCKPENQFANLRCSRFSYYLSWARYMSNTELEAFSPMIVFNPLSMVSGCPQGEAYLEKWMRFIAFLENTESRQRELDDLWK